MKVSPVAGTLTLELGLFFLSPPAVKPLEEQTGLPGLGRKTFDVGAIVFKGSISVPLRFSSSSVFNGI